MDDDKGVIAQERRVMNMAKAADFFYSSMTGERRPRTRLLLIPLRGASIFLRRQLQRPL
jgi:hypothetical protein